MKIHPDKKIDRVVRKLPRLLSHAELHSFFNHLKEESERQHVSYEKDDGSLRLIRVMSTPRLLTLAQRRYLQQVTYLLHHAFFKIGHLYLARPDVRALLPFPDADLEWVLRYLPIALKQKGEVVSRWDAVCDFSRNGRLSTLHFVENNAVGIGGIYYIPTTERVVWKAIVPTLRHLMPRVSFWLNPNLQGFLLRSLLRHARRLGLNRPQIGLIAESYTPGGPVEFPHLAEFLQARGIRAQVCDARDLRLRHGQIYYRDFRIDLLYRDSELSEFIDYESEGRSMGAVRQAFAENRVVSSILGELDHKSLLEIYTSEKFARFFTAAERAIFRRHALWTRLLTDRRTTDPHGKKIALPTYARRHQNQLVIKPNKLFGGEGVVLGKNLSRRVWEKEIEKALCHPGDWVVQQQAKIVSKPYLERRAGGFEVKDFHFVLGLAPVAGGLGILGRASQREVVNVARLGGLAAILLTS